jgi:aspartate carbamoyltransferase catalytic subunit
MNKPLHFISTKDMPREEIEGILDLALFFEDSARGIRPSNLLTGKVLCTLFYEPSTRTRLSFESAMVRLGGQVISVADAMRTSSAWKGETIADTVRTIQNYADVIAMRNPVNGAAAEAAKYAQVPIINAGDGANEHPTQALLDLLTIKREVGRIDGTTIVLIGDHAHSRPINSLLYALSNYKAKVILVNPQPLAVRRDVLEYARGKGLQVEETENLPSALKEADVVYIFRIQKERFSNSEDYEAVKGSYQLTRSMLEEAGRKLTILHPMPRLDELPDDVDALSGAAYFRQSFNGVLVRMALLSLVLGKVQLRSYLSSEHA